MPRMASGRRTEDYPTRRRCTGIADPKSGSASAFQQKKIDAVWTVEPWVSQLENEAGDKVLVDESDATTTMLVSSAKFLNEKRELASKFVQANRDLTD